MSMKFLCHFFWLILLDIRVSTPSSLCPFTWKIFFNILVWDNVYIWCWLAFLLRIRQMDPSFASSLLVFIFKLVFEFIDNKGYQWLLFDNSYLFVVGGDDLFVNFGLCVCVFPLFGFSSVRHFIFWVFKGELKLLKLEFFLWRIFWRAYLFKFDVIMKYLVFLFYVDWKLLVFWSGLASVVS